MLNENFDKSQWHNLELRFSDPDLNASLAVLSLAAIRTAFSPSLRFIYFDTVTPSFLAWIHSHQPNDNNIFLAVYFSIYRRLEMDLL